MLSDNDWIEIVSDSRWKFLNGNERQNFCSWIWLQICKGRWILFIFKYFNSCHGIKRENNEQRWIPNLANRSKLRVMIFWKCAWFDNWQKGEFRDLVCSVCVVLWSNIIKVKSLGGGRYKSKFHILCTSETGIKTAPDNCSFWIVRMQVLTSLILSQMSLKI